MPYKSNITTYFPELIFKSPSKTNSRSRYYRPLGFGEANQRAALSIREYFGSYFTGEDSHHRNTNEMWHKAVDMQTIHNAAERPGAPGALRTSEGTLHGRDMTLKSVDFPRSPDISTGFTGPTPVWAPAYSLGVREGDGHVHAQTVKGDVQDLELRVLGISINELVQEQNPGETAHNYLFSKALKTTRLGDFNVATQEWDRHDGFPSYMGTLREGMYFDDFVFETPSPLLPSDMNAVLVNNPFYLSVKPEYSYLVPSYEENIANHSLSDTALPSLYAFTSEASGQFRDADNSIFNQLITLNGRIDGIMVDQVEDNIKVSDVDEGQYFQKYATAVSAMAENDNLSDLSELSDDYKNVYFANDSYNLLKSSHEKRNLFPMHVEVEMNTSTDTSFVETMSELKINNFILPRMLDPEPPLPGVRPSSTRMVRIVQKQQTTQDVDSPLLTASRPAFNSVRTLPFNASTFKDDYLAPLTGPDAQISNVVIYGPTGDRIYNEMNNDELYKTIASAMTSAKLEQTYEANKRTFFDILSGTPAYSEVVGYEICKYRSAAASQLISKTIIPNSNKLDVIKYIDTQVRYNRLYEYRIKQLVLVFGSRVYFDETPGVAAHLPARQINSPGAWRMPQPGADVQSFPNGSAFLRTIVVPNIKLCEVDYGESLSARVVDDPPPPPEVHLVPYKGKDDRVLFNINNSFGEFVAPGVPIEVDGDNNDLDKFSRVRETQGNLRNDRGQEVVRFTGDDIAKEFQIYRLEHWPSSYEEFAGAELETSPLDTTYRGSRYDSRSLVDYIEPNKYYYYTARTVDYHGFISNPTELYEVRMVNNDGIIMPSIRIVPLAPSGLTRIPSRDMRRYIQIAPNYANQMITPDQLATVLEGVPMPESTKDIDLQDIEVGMNIPSVWGRTFKLRFTSRATGRKFDVNLGVNLTKKGEE
jgi:hypothetical protein